MLVNEGRLARTRLALNRQQQVFLDLLPLLFHVNHPMLPGYVSHQTPCGVAGYEPEKADIQRAQRLARSFNYRRQPTMLHQIHALYLMGSCGTVGQSSASDLDIWLCHGNELTRDAVIELKRKGHLIEHWAASLGLEVHFFVMDWDAFRRGERAGVSTEDCGSTQHYLLLDEFYRTGLLIAGRAPIWWLVPPADDGDYERYADTLRRKRYIRPDDTLDFGGVTQIPAGEFIGAGIWQLYKGIASPYKSVLKLLLTEVYASEYPQSQSLAQRYKQAIYAGRLDIDELDPYVMIYRRLEHYLLERNEHERLELVRRCFYFKVGKKLSKPPQHAQASWQRILLQKLVSEWGWSRRQIELLDAASQWKAAKVGDERKMLVRELTNSYRFLVDFARRSQTDAMINQQDMTILGRKLYAAFERRAGKIDLVNPGITTDLSEPNLSLYLQEKDVDGSTQRLWSLHAEPLAREEQPLTLPLKRCDNLIELLAWGLINGIIGSHSHLDIAPGAHQLDAGELNALLRALRQQLLPALAHTPDNDTFLAPAQALQQLVFVNVGTDPLDAVKKRGLQRLSDQTDSLGYSGLRDNLVLTLDVVTRNSWGEVSCRHFDGAAALLNCLRDHLQTPAPDAGRDVRVACFCASRGPAIAGRVQELFDDVARCYAPQEDGSVAPKRYVLQVRSFFYLLQYREQILHIALARNHDQLLQQLGTNQAGYSPIVLDRHALPGSMLAAIAYTMQPDTVCVYFQLPRTDGQPPKADTDAMAQIFITDERGSLLTQRLPCTSLNTLLHPLDVFLRSVWNRQQIYTSARLREGRERIRYFELSQLSPGAAFRAIPFDAAVLSALRERQQEGHAPGSMALNTGFAVQAIASLDGSGRPLFTMFCDQQEFSPLDYGDELYREVARYIVGRRRTHARYPCYITDLDLSALLSTDALADTDQGTIQTIDYLRYRQLLEQGLNRALQNL